MADSLDALMNPGAARHGRRAGSITSSSTSSYGGGSTSYSGSSSSYGGSSYDSSSGIGRKLSLGGNIPAGLGASGSNPSSNPSSGTSSFNPSPVLSRQTSRPGSKGDLDNSFSSSIAALGSTLPDRDGSAGRRFSGLGSASSTVSSTPDRDGSAGRRASALTGRRANPSLGSSLSLSDDIPDSINNISGSSSFSPSVGVSTTRRTGSASSTNPSASLPAAPTVVAPTSSTEPVTYRSSLYATTKDNKENNGTQANNQSQSQSQPSSSQETSEYTPSVGKRWGSLTSRMQPAEDAGKKVLAPLDADETPVGSSQDASKRAAPLFPCPDCGRQFKRQALIVHQRSCKKVQSKRETFNMAEKRLQDVLEQDKQLANQTPAFDKDTYQEKAQLKNAEKQKEKEKKGKKQQSNNDKNTDKEKEPRVSIKEKILAAQKEKQQRESFIEDRPLDSDIPHTKQPPQPNNNITMTEAEKVADAEKKASWRAESLKLRDQIKNSKKMYNGGAGAMGIDISRMMPKM